MSISGSSSATRSPGYIGDGDQPGGNRSASHQEHHDRCDLRRCDENLEQPRGRQFTIDDHRDEERIDRGDNTCLRRRENTELQAENDNHRQHQGPDGIDERLHSNRRLCRGGRANCSLRATRSQVTQSANAISRPGTDTGQKQLGDRDATDDAVEDKADRRRDDRADDRRGGQKTAGAGWIMAGFQHHRVEQSAERSGTPPPPSLTGWTGYRRQRLRRSPSRHGRGRPVPWQD